MCSKEWRWFLFESHTFFVGQAPTNQHGSLRVRRFWVEMAKESFKKVTDIRVKKFLLHFDGAKTRMADKSVSAHELNLEFMFGLMNKRCGIGAEESKCEGAENVNAAAILRLIFFFFLHTSFSAGYGCALDFRYGRHNNRHQCCRSENGAIFPFPCIRKYEIDKEECVRFRWELFTAFERIFVPFICKATVAALLIFFSIFLPLLIVQSIPEFLCRRSASIKDEILKISPHHQWDRLIIHSGNSVSNAIVQCAQFVHSISHMSIFPGMFSCWLYQFNVLMMVVMATAAAAVAELLNQRWIVLYV